MIDLFPNGTIVFQWIIFATAYVILNVGIFRPVVLILEKRRALTEGAHKRAATLEAEANHLLKECEKQLHEARLASLQERDKQRQLTEKMQTELLQEIRQEVRRQVEQSNRDIQKQLREAVLQSRQHAQGLSHEIAAKILGRAA